MLENKSIGLKEAREILEAMEKAARETDPPDRPLSMAICDNKGDLIYYHRMDGASAITTWVAVNKAYTVVQWGMSTRELRDVLWDNNIDITWYGNPRFCAIDGGAVLKAKDGSIVGGIGTSGRSLKSPMPDGDLALLGVKVYQNMEA